MRMQISWFGFWHTCTPVYFLSEDYKYRFDFKNELKGLRNGNVSKYKVHYLLIIITDNCEKRELLRVNNWNVML